MLESGPRTPREGTAIYEAFQRIGRDCFLAGLVSSHAGNLSVRLDDRLLITRRGAMLGALEQDDLVEAAVFEDGEEPAASCELPTHREIYRRSQARAVVHTHPVHGIVLSLDRDRIEPVDVEGAFQLGATAVVQAEEPVASLEMARLVGDELSRSGLCMLRGHGLFAAGADLEDAFRLTTAFEASARVGYLALLARGMAGPR